MIGAELVTNSTSTVSPYDIHISIFTFAPIVAGCMAGIILSIFLFALMLKKDPTIVWRAKRLSWIYSFWRSPSDDLKILPVMEEDIDPSSNTFDYKTRDGKEYTHSLQTMSSTSTQLGKDGKPVGKDGKSIDTKDNINNLSEKREFDETKKTRFTYKGHPAYIHSFDQFEPHAFVPHSLEASISPSAVYRTKDGNIRKQIDSIRVEDKITKTSVTLIILIVLVMIIGIGVYAQSASIMGILQEHFKATSTNSTATPSCPIGYSLNTRGVCVPQVPIMSFLGLLIPSFSFLPKVYRRYLGMSKSKALMTSIISILFIPSTTISLFVSKTKLGFENTIGSPYNYDVIIVVTNIMFWSALWKGWSMIGDWIFKKANPWHVNYSSLSMARKLFKFSRKQYIGYFLKDVEQFARIEEWLSLFSSKRPTMVCIGDLS